MASIFTIAALAPIAVFSGAAHAGLPRESAQPPALVVRLGQLERVPNGAGATCDPAGQCRPGAAAEVALVRVNVVLSLAPNVGHPVALDVVAGSKGGITLYIGADRRTAAVDCGFVGEVETLCTDNRASVPTHVVPGRTVILCESFDVPMGELGALTVTVQPPVSDASGRNPMLALTFEHAERHLVRTPR